VKFVKKATVLILLAIFVLCFSGCVAQYGVRKISLLKSDEVISLLSGEVTTEESPSAVLLTSSDEPWEAYLAGEKGIKTDGKKHLLDDPIVQVLPKLIFTTLGTHTYIGSEWGYYVHTTVYESGLNNVDVFLFDIENDYHHSTGYYTLKLNPILEYQYRCILDYKDAENPDDPARVLIVNDGEKSLNRYFLSNVALTFGAESANIRNLPIFADHIEFVSFYFDGKIVGGSGEEGYLLSAVPNRSLDSQKTMWWAGTMGSENGDPTTKADLSIPDSLSSHEFYFDEWLTSITLRPFGIQSVANGAAVWAPMTKDHLYFPGQAKPIEGEIEPIEYTVGEIVPTALVFGMGFESQIQLYLNTTRLLPQIVNGSDEPFSIFVTNEIVIETALSLDILYQGKDDKLVVVASAEYRSQSETASVETMRLFETVSVSIRTPGAFDCFPLYVESDGTYLLLNGGAEDGLTVDLYDTDQNLIAHFEDGSEEVSLEASKLYWVVAKFQDPDQIGEFQPLALWPI